MQFRSKALALILGSTLFSSAFAVEVINKAWGLYPPFGVDAPKAWSAMKKNCSKSGIVVAVIDTGIDMNHPALRDSLWTNPKEGAGKDGVDDDGNGYVDDLHGFDFAKNTGRLSDSHGHGTHIAGIISGNGNGPDGFKGVCPGVKIMALRYYNENGSGADNLRNTVRAIEYAVKMGANIINYSGGGAQASEPERKALEAAEAKGILVVAAAGNERSDADRNLYFPAAYGLSNIISVTAIDNRGQILPSSNWGVSKVHVAAPGQSILSTLPNGSFGFMSGTSQATAFVSGVAAMLLSENPSLKPMQLRSMIEASGQKYPQLYGKTKTGAKVNAFYAVEMLHTGRMPTTEAKVAKVASLEDSRVPQSKGHPKKARKRHIPQRL